MLRAYIAEWGKFFTQCEYLPRPFNQLEANLMGKLHSSMPKKQQSQEESLVRKVPILVFLETLFKIDLLCDKIIFRDQFSADP